MGQTDSSKAARANFGDIASPDDETNKYFLSLVFAASTVISDVETCRDLLPRLTPLAGTMHLTGGFSVGRLCGEAAVLLGKPDGARGYYAQALAVCEKVRFRPELAITRLHFAELLLEHYPDERAAAIEHLDIAIAEFGEMKMQPSLEQSLRHRRLLKA